MADQELKKLVAQGLQALKAGSEVAKMATGEISNDARHPELKAALQAGNRTAEQWAQRIQRAIAEAGPADDVGNPILDALHDVSKKIRQVAPDDTSRDLGIIAAGQLALHYWIAAFGTLRTYASNLSMSQTEQDFQVCVDEAKQADQQHTELAKKLLSANG